MNLLIEPLSTFEDLEWCGRTMSESDPWITLRRQYDECRAVLSDRSKESYLLRDDGSRVGVLILDMNGPFPGYIQSICVAPAARGRGIGSRAIAWAEERILRDSPNVFICVSSFNPRAQRLYARLGYEHIATLKSFIVDEHDEWLLRKTRGSWDSYLSSRMAP